MGDPRDHATVQFIRHDAARFVDARTRSALGVLLVGNVLTDRQVEAGFLVGRICGEHDRWHGQRRSAASPAYERSYGRGSETPADTKLIRRAERRWQKLQECFEVVPPAQVATTRAAVERLCCENRYVSTAELDIIAPMLDYIAQVFEIPGAPAHDPSIAITARRPPRRPQAPRARRTELEKEAWLKCQCVLRPDLDAAGLEQAWCTFNQLKATLSDRDKFRRKKGRR